MSHSFPESRWSYFVMLSRGRSDWQEWHPGIIACLCRGNSRRSSFFLFSSSVRCQADTVLDKGVSCRNLVTFSLSMKYTFWRTSGSCWRTTDAICNLLVLFHPLWLWGGKSTNMMIYKKGQLLEQGSLGDVTEKRIHGDMWFDKRNRNRRTP